MTDTPDLKALSEAAEAAQVLLREWDEHGEGLLGELCCYTPGGDLDYFEMDPDIDGEWVKQADVEKALRALAQTPREGGE